MTTGPDAVGPAHPRDLCGMTATWAGMPCYMPAGICRIPARARAFGQTFVHVHALALASHVRV